MRILAFFAPILFFVFSLPTLASEPEPRAFKAGLSSFLHARSALNPVPDDSVSTILPLSDFLTLTREQQGLYLDELRLIMTKLEAEDQFLHTEYQSASRSIYEVWISEAKASSDDSDRRCVYAGQISEMDINGRYCMAPPGECKTRGSVMCNPVLYGIVGCVPSGRRATSMCEQKKKPIGAIITDIKSSGDKGLKAYSTLRSQLSDYCKTPRPSQKNVCAMIRTQLARINRVIGKVPAPKYETTSSKRSAPPRSRDAGAASADRLTAKGPKAAPAETQDIVVAPAESKSAPQISTKSPTQTPPLELTRSSGLCQPASLLANMRPESVPNKPASNFMNLESARTLMCSTDPIPDWFIEQQRSSVAANIRAIRGGDKYAKADRLNYDGILKNFNACVQDAKTLRSTGAGSVSGKFASLSVSGTLLSLKDEQGRPIVGVGSVFDQEGLFRAKGISICNIQTQDDVHLAPVYGGARSQPGESTGSAQ